MQGTVYKRVFLEQCGGGDIMDPLRNVMCRIVCTCRVVWITGGGETLAGGAATYLMAHY